MRKNIVAGNWKMNKNLAEGEDLVNELVSKLKGEKLNCEVIVATPFIHLASVAKLISGSPLKLSAQNCSDKESGAYTGEVSASMIKSAGASFVILGHSERRAYYGETNEVVKTKVDVALADSLKPIVCVGENLDQREEGNHFEIIRRQIVESLFHLSANDFERVVLAYEPVWAIGTGKTATGEQAQEIHSFIRRLVAEKYGTSVAEDLTILYGGSCKPSNAKELFANPDVDGGLIGGASLKADDFIGIIKAF